MHVSPLRPDLTRTQSFIAIGVAATCIVAMLTACAPGSAEQPRAFSSATSDRHLPAAGTAVPTSRAVAATTDARRDVDAVLARVRQATSYRARMRGLLGQDPAVLEYVAPDRYRMRLGTQMDTIVIGDDVYITMNGNTTHSKRDPVVPDVTSMGLQAMKAAKVQTLGEDTFEGRTTRVYRIDHPEGARGHSKLWVATDSGLPVRIQTVTPMGTKALEIDAVYSDFNDPSIKVEPPTRK